MTFHPPGTEVEKKLVDNVIDTACDLMEQNIITWCFVVHFWKIWFLPSSNEL